MPAQSGQWLNQNEWRTAGRMLGVLRPGRMARIRGAAIFRAGFHKDQHYTEADLDAMARNFKQARGAIDNPLVVGHEEHQFFTGTPAVGWVERLYRRGDTLYADFADVPPSIAKLVNRKAYRKVSAEVYDEPPPGAPTSCRGKMLRRVALLGGEMPYVKTIGDLPMAEYSEGQPRDCRPWALRQATNCQRGEGSFTVFYEAEVKPMADDTDLDMGEEVTSRQQSADNLVAAGVAQSEIDALAGVDDNVFLAWAVARLAAMQGADTGGMLEEEPIALAEPEEMSREDLIAELVAMGEDPAVLEGMSDEELQEMVRAMKGETMSENKRKAKGRRPAAAATFSEKRIKELEARLAAAERQASLSLASKKKANVTSFCESMVKQGKLTPAQAEPGKGPVWRRLMRADAVKGVAKFGEQVATELDMQMREIELGGPVRRYGVEQVPDPLQQSEFEDVDRQTKEYAERRNRQMGVVRN